jgi:hypothetical protein
MVNQANVWFASSHGGALEFNFGFEFQQELSIPASNESMPPYTITENNRGSQIPDRMDGDALVEWVSFFRVGAGNSAAIARSLF